jgi:hypothetical protein
LPGGFGTLDEGLEVLTLLQTGKREMVPVVMLDAPGGDFWQEFQRFIERQLLDRKMISPEDTSLYKLTDRVDVAVDEILQFFRVYHSMRYVKNKLVFRLTQTLSDQLLEQINTRFADILTEGRFELTTAFKEEHDEPSLIALPRLAFRFNRRNLGRLRQLIDCINRGHVS